MARDDNYDGPILEIENLSISFMTRLFEIPAVMDFSCTVMPGEAMGLVGESWLRQVHSRPRCHDGPRQERPRCGRLHEVQGPRVDDDEQ